MLYWIMFAMRFRLAKFHTVPPFLHLCSQVIDAKDREIALLKAQLASESLYITARGTTPSCNERSVASSTPLTKPPEGELLELRRQVAKFTAAVRSRWLAQSAAVHSTCIQMHNLCREWTSSCIAGFLEDVCVLAYLIR